MRQSHGIHSRFGDLKLDNVSAAGTEASVSGSGTAILTGTSQEADYRVAGSGDLFASGLQAKRVSASVSGSGDIKCHATDFLKARTSGSGNIGYKGNPELDFPKEGIIQALILHTLQGGNFPLPNNNKRDAASRGVPFILVSFYKILRELKLHSLCFCFNKSTLTILYLKQMKMLF